MSAVGPRNLARLAEEAHERWGDYPAVFFEDSWFDSAELFRRATRLAAGLSEGGLGAGDRVVVMMENLPDVPVIYDAVFRAGAVIVPVIFLLNPEELHRIVVDSQASAVITSKALRAKVDAATADVAGLRFVVSAGEELTALEAAQPASIVPRSDDDLSALVYTGGTTGSSKGVMLSHANLWEAGRQGQSVGYAPGVTRGLTCLPLSHSYGLLVLTVSRHARERPESVLMRWFDAPSWLALAERQRVQISAVVPSMLYRLLQEPLERFDLSALTAVVSGAAPLDLRAAREFMARVPGVELREGYGLTETAALLATNPPGKVRLGTVGPAVPGTKVRLLDDAGREVAAGEAGEICVRSAHVMRGYWNEPELTANTLADGWLRTGDIGRLDESGYLSIIDRKKDLILRGGLNVFPRDVEEVLVEHPDVTAACVIGRPDSLHGEEVVAFVTLRKEANLSPDELVAYAREHLAAYKYPREIHVVSALPLTPVGKADRKALRQILTDQGART
ncbi:MAG: AMP-binding protein [Acidimicrobiales bacterium]